MRYLNPPTFAVAEMLAEGLLTETDPAVAARVGSSIPEAERHQRNASAAFGSSTTASLDPTDFELDGATQDDIRMFYSARIVRRNSGGRPRYDQLLLAAPHGICPYCAERRVSALDHYLPQSKYWSLTAAPVNLVPACTDCNFKKRNYTPDAARPAVLHPYFDQGQDFQWLVASVIDEAGPVVLFEADDSGAPSPEAGQRAVKHFQLFGLQALYEAHASQRLDQLDRVIGELFRGGGSVSVQTYLAAEAQRLSGDVTNSWEGALYGALSVDDWYCATYAQARCDLV